MHCCGYFGLAWTPLLRARRCWLAGMRLLILLLALHLRPHFHVCCHLQLLTAIVSKGSSLSYLHNRQQDVSRDLAFRNQSRMALGRCRHVCGLTSMVCVLLPARMMFFYHAAKMLPSKPGMWHSSESAT